MNTMEHMDNVLRRARLKAGLTARELAARAGTSHSTLIAYETGRKTPRTDTRDRIIRAAGFVPMDSTLRRRVRTNPQGTPRWLELCDVVLLAEQYPNARPKTLGAPIFPDRLGP